MKAKSTIEPTAYAVEVLPTGEAEVVVRENIAQTTEPAGPELKEQATVWEYDEYRSRVRGRDNIAAAVAADPASWLASIKAEVLAQARTDKLSEISDTCEKTIYAGVDVTLPTGTTAHFSLTEKDQINITAAQTAIKAGATQFPYHADGDLCRMYSGEEIAAIETAATKFVLYHTTYCNHLNRWIDRSTSEDEIRAIYYGIPLPDDLKTSMDAIVGAGA
jgi:hypothetical protein